MPFLLKYLVISYSVGIFPFLEECRKYLKIGFVVTFYCFILLIIKFYPLPQSGC